MTKYYCEVLFYPLPSDGQVCLSRESNSSRVSLVVDDEQLGESLQQVKDKPDHLNILLGIWPEHEEKLPEYFLIYPALVFVTIDIANL